MQMASFPSFLSLTRSSTYQRIFPISPCPHQTLSTFNRNHNFPASYQAILCVFMCMQKTEALFLKAIYLFLCFFSLCPPSLPPPPVCLSFSFLCRQDLSLAWNSVSVFIQLQGSACLCTITLRFWFWFLTLILGTQLMSAKHLINWAISLATQQALCMCIYVCTCKGNQNTALDIVLQALGSAS